MGHAADSNLAGELTQSAGTVHFEATPVAGKVVTMDPVAQVSAEGHELASTSMNCSDASPTTCELAQAPREEEIAFSAISYKTNAAFALRVFEKLRSRRIVETTRPGARQREANNRSHVSRARAMLDFGSHRHRCSCRGAGIHSQRPGSALAIFSVLLACTVVGLIQSRNELGQTFGMIVFGGPD